MNKKVLLIASGVGALVAGALLYNYFSSGPSDEKFALLHRDLQEIDKVNKDGSGVIKYQDFLKLFGVVMRHAKKEVKGVKGRFAERRRKALKEGNNAEYKEAVLEQVQDEEAVYQEVAMEALSYFNISEQDFMISQGVHMQNPAFQKSMMDLHMTSDEKKSGKSITKEKAKEMFIFIEESKQEMMKSYKDLDMMGDGG